MPSSFHDRRGFDTALKVCLVMIVVSFAVMILVNWVGGLVMIMLSCIAFISGEAASAPPANCPLNFRAWVRNRPSRKPVLLCLGDSNTHGTVCSSYTPEIPVQLSKALGLPPPSTNFFMDPVWVVNAGQNFLTTHSILHERLHSALGCYPDFVLLMIGTNDMQCVYGPKAKILVSVNQLPEVPTMQVYERNLTKILEYIEQNSPMTQVGVCTLPPLGEDLKAEPNKIIRQANDVVERVVTKHGSEKVTVVPVYDRFEAILEKKPKSSISSNYSTILALIQVPLFYLLSFQWKRTGSVFGNILLHDGLHINEAGRDQIVDAVVEWLIKANVAKAIAVKQ